MPSTQTKQVVIPSDLSEALKVVEMLIAAAGERGFSENNCFAIRLALDEAVANAIRHGNAGDPAKSVRVDYQIDQEQFRVTICDEGPGFSPEEVPDPTLDENLERPCGRGVMLMRAYMNDVTFNDKGNCVTMVKLRDKGAADA